MIVDALAHITKEGIWFDTSLTASLDSLILSMEECKVDKAMLVGLPSTNDNDIILEAVENYPGKFIPFAGIDVSMDDNEIYESVLRAKHLGFTGIKLHPRLSVTPITHPIFKKVLQLAGKLDLVAMVCTIHRPPLPALRRPLSDALYELCLACDNTRIILVHGGYTDILATSEMIRPLEHILLDLSVTLTRFRNTSIGMDVAWLLDSFDRRICVGSDYPEGNMKDVMSVLSNILGDSWDNSRIHSISQNLISFIA